jgi:hypothetical protein
MSLIKRKNSFWQLYGMLIICWGLYLFLVLIGNATIAFLPVLVLVFFSLILIFSQWSSNVEVLFHDNYLTTKHYFKSKYNDYAYTDIKSVEYLYTKVLGRRLIFKCLDPDSQIMEFIIYNPDDELLEFISSRIKTYKNRIA